MRAPKLVNIGAMAAAIEKREADHRAEIAAAIAKPLLVDTHEEAKVLAAILVEGSLERCDSLEVDDFSDLRHKVVHSAIRELQHAGAELEPLAVFDHIEARDHELDTHKADKVDLLFLVELVSHPAPYDLERSLGWLRTLATRRASL